MTIKACLDNLFDQNNAVKDFITSMSNSNDADKTIVNYVEYLENTKYNSSLSVAFANTLQFASQ